MSLAHWFTQADALSLVVALVLCAMSVLSWVLIVYKSWLLSVAQRDITLCLQVWAQSPNWQQVQQAWAALDTQQLFAGLLQNHLSFAQQGMTVFASREDQLSSSLRQALQGIRQRLRYGQDLLATIAATSPFIGLLGTVWGIYHALVSLAQAGQYTLDKVAQPVGESLVMTAAGLGVAIPAVMAYNLLVKRLSAIEVALDGMAFDLRAYFLSQPQHEA
jgi:biopolymer transport protein ExbB